MLDKEEFSSFKKNDDYYSLARDNMLTYVPQSCKTVMEAGCGEGNFAQLVKMRNNAEVWGIEINEAAAAKAFEKIDRVFTGDIAQVLDKLPEKFFDCVIFNDVLEHLSDPYDTLIKVKSLLQDRGIVVSSIPNVRYIINLKELLVDKDWKYRDYGILDYTHYRFFTKKSIVRMFESTGYEIIRLEGINPARKFTFHVLNTLLLGHIADTRYSQFACVARKAE